jgi:GrpB-like predicted nucleotidyltransferase (UPF0157 family)
LSTDAPVEIVSYDRQWPGRFQAELELLLNGLGPWLAARSIEHIGSTAVPGVAAKPVIDIMAGVETLEGSRAARITYNSSLWAAGCGPSSSRFATICERAGLQPAYMLCVLCSLCGLCAAADQHAAAITK